MPDYEPLGSEHEIEVVTPVRTLPRTRLAVCDTSFHGLSAPSLGILTSVLGYLEPNSRVATKAASVCAAHPSSRCKQEA